MEIIKFLEKANKQFLPNLSIDLVIIGYQNNKLKCLLLQIDEKWLLPGGYIRISESVDDAAIRILKERTGLDNPHLKFLSVFGNKDRQFKNEWKEFIKNNKLVWKDDYWINNRFVTLTYYSLVNIAEIHPTPGIMDEAIFWFDFDDLPEIWMDHKSILTEARNRLKEDLKHEQLTYNLLPGKFTMPELHQLHQAILEEKLDRSRFQKKILSTGLFDRLPKKPKKNSPGQNPYQYRIKSD